MRRRINRKKMMQTATHENDGVQEPVLIKKQKEKQTSAFYNSGPALAISNILDQGVTGRHHNSVEATANAERSSQQLVLPTVKGKGNASHSEAMGSSVSLDGRTDADYDGGSFSTENVRVSSATDCDSCAEESACIRARGVLAARYHVTTTVTLPSANDFPDLTPCQRDRVQNAIDTILAPHEQEHVTAFRQYNGVTRTPFDVTLCRSEFDASIQSVFESQESTRRASAQAASDALDPFNFTVDIDCVEPTSAEPTDEPLLDKQDADINNSPNIDSSLQKGQPQ